MKTITITDEAYGALATLKMQGESFTKLILRFFRPKNAKPTLHSIFGAITESEYRAMKQEHELFKKHFRSRL